jgi:hypothetical protein
MMAAAPEPVIDLHQGGRAGSSLAGAASAVDNGAADSLRVF